MTRKQKVWFFQSAFLTDLSHFMSILMCENMNNNNSKISEIEAEILMVFCYKIIHTFVINSLVITLNLVNFKVYRPTPGPRLSMSL